MSNDGKITLDVVVTRSDTATEIFSANPRTPDRDSLVGGGSKPKDDTDVTPKKKE